MSADNKWKWLQSAASAVFGFVFVLCFWYVARFLVTADNRWLLPSPYEVAKLVLTNGTTFLNAAVSTGQATLLGFAVGAITGFCMAIAFHLIPSVGRALLPFVSTLPAIPVIAVAPLVVLWLGFGISSKVFIIAFICFFPVLVTVLAGLTQGYPAQREFLKMQGASRRARFLYMDLPSAVTFFGAGIKTAAPLAVIGAIVAEYVAPKDGLGYLVLTYALRTNTTGVIAAALSCACLGLLFSGFAALSGALLQRRFPPE